MSSSSSPLGLFRSAGFSAGSGIGALVNLGYYGQLFVLSLYFQDVLLYLPLAAGLAFLPALAATVPLSWAAGRMTAKYGPLRPTVLGLLVGMTGLALLVFADSTSSYWVILPGMLLVSAGGLVPAPLSVAVISSVSEDRSGIASGVLNAFRQTGGAIGIAILGSLIAAQGFMAGMRWALIVSVATYLLSLLLALRYMRTPRPASSAGTAGSDG